jgi:hypothetical protein
LSDPDWRQVDGVLAALGSAVERQDPVATRSAVVTLTLIAPSRTGRGLSDALKGPPRRHIPVQTSDVVHRLLHRIGLPPEHNVDDPEPEGSNRVSDVDCDDAA